MRMAKGMFFLFRVSMCWEMNQAALASARYVAKPSAVSERDQIKSTRASTKAGGGRSPGLSTTTPAENVEKVVSPPGKPVNASGRHSGDSDALPEKKAT